MAGSIDKRIKQFEEHILDTVSADMVFETMNKHMIFEPLYMVLDNSVYLHSFIKNELTSYVFSDFFMKDLETMINEEYDDEWEAFDARVAYGMQIRDGAFHEKVTRLTTQCSSPAHTACMRLIRFAETDIVPTMTPDRVFPFLDVSPHVAFRRIVSPALVEEFTRLSETYYTSLFPGRETCSERKFVEFMIRNFCNHTSNAFKEALLDCKRKYTAGQVISRAYRSYKMRYLLPLVAIRSVSNDMIKYRPGSGIEWQRASAFFENKEWEN